MEWYARVLSVLDNSVTLLLGAVIALSLLIFGPDILLNRLSLVQWVNDNLSTLSLFWVCGLSLLIARSGKPIPQSLANRWKKFRKRQKAKNHLTTLSPEEKELLRNYFEWNVKTREHSFGDGVVTGLARKGILYTPSAYYEMKMRGPMSDFNMQEWAWSYIRQNPNLIDWNGEPLSETARKKRLNEQAKRNRNSWMGV